MELNYSNKLQYAPLQGSGTSIKVAHVIRVFSYGGAEVLLREFFAQPEFKEQVISDVFVLDHKKLGLREDVKPNIRSFFYYKITTWKFLFEYIRFLRDIKKGSYDVVHVNAEFGDQASDHDPQVARFSMPA